MAGTGGTGTGVSAGSNFEYGSGTGTVNCPVLLVRVGYQTLYPQTSTLAYFEHYYSVLLIGTDEEF